MYRSVSPPQLFFLFLLHTAVWTLYGVISNPGAIHHDMMEAYLWGHEFQLGYFKHPPLWAWLAGAWFEVFPRGNWAFYLLASLNSAFALLGVWRLYSLFVKDAIRQTGVLLLLATPLYTFLALKFNANAMLLCLFPWTAYFFAKSIERISLQAAILSGVFAAAGMLSKYYSALLLASIFAASLIHPNARRYYRSAAPYVTVAVFLLLLVPHAAWMLDHGFQTVKYAQTRASFSSMTVFRSTFAFIFGSIAFFVIPIGLAIAAGPAAAMPWLPFRRPSKDTPRSAFSNPDNRAMPVPDIEEWERTSLGLDRSRWRFLLIVALGPAALSVLSAIIFHVRLSTNFAIPILFLIPLVIIGCLRPDVMRLRRFALVFAAGLYALALPIAAAVPYIMVLQKKPEFFAPVLEIARLAKDRWAAVTQAPVRTVAGSLRYGMAAAFYGDGEVKEFTGFEQSFAPWITPERLARTGLLAICLKEDAQCNERAAALMTPASHRETATLSRHYGTAEGPPYTFELFIIPPR